MAKIGQLEKVDIRSVWKGEASEFTPWLAQEDNLTLLGELIGLDLELQSQEQPVGDFRADIICKDEVTGSFVIIENQYGSTNHDHLGKLLTYSAGVGAGTIIWITEKFRDEHRATLDWLNRFTSEEVNFFGIEIELFRIGESLPAPNFKLVSSPNNWSKVVRRSAESGDLSETKLTQQEYWQGLKDFVEKGKFSYRMKKPQPSHWSSISIGRTHFLIDAIANSRDKLIRVNLTLSGANSDRNFELLKERFEKDAKTSIAPSIEWIPKTSEHVVQRYISVILENTDPLDKKTWSEQHKWMADMVEKFYLFFKDKIRDLE